MSVIKNNTHFLREMDDSFFDNQEIMQELSESEKGNIKKCIEKINIWLGLI